MWKCKKCGNEVEMYTMTFTEKRYKLKKDKNLAVLKNDSIKEKTGIFYRCTECDNFSSDLKEIAEWEE